MTKYMAYVKQKMEGCDYSIGCGQTLWELAAQTRNEAISELRGRVLGDNEEQYYPLDENELDSVLLLEVTTTEKMPVSQWYAEVREAQTKEAVLWLKQAEREEYERLKKKFEG